MLLMIEKGIKGGTCHSVYQYPKSNNKYMKDYDKNKQSSHLKFWDLNNLFRWAMSQKLPVNDFKPVKDISEFNKDFMKSYNHESNERYFLKLMLNMLKIYTTFKMI